MVRTPRKKRKKHYRSGVHNSPKAGECVYRSGWELGFMKYLDLSPDVVSYEYESLVIFYLSNIMTARMRKYIPDFVVKYSDGRTEIIEIKPKKRMTNLKVQKKHAAAEIWSKAHGMTFRVITESDLKLLGIVL